MSDQQRAIADSTDVLGLSDGTTLTSFRTRRADTASGPRRPRTWPSRLPALRRRSSAGPPCSPRSPCARTGAPIAEVARTELETLRMTHCRRYVATDLREDTDHADLSQVGALSGAVGTEDELRAHERRQQQVVGDERRLCRRQRVYSSGTSTDVTPRLLQRKQLRVNRLSRTDRPLVESRTTCLSSTLLSYTSWRPRTPPALRGCREHPAAPPPPSSGFNRATSPTRASGPIDSRTTSRRRTRSCETVSDHTYLLAGAIDALLGLDTPALQPPQTPTCGSARGGRQSTAPRDFAPCAAR